MISNASARTLTFAGFASAIPIPHLIDNGYPALSLELPMVAVFFGLIGAVLGFIARGRLLNGIATGLVFYWFVDANIIVSSDIQIAILVGASLTIAWFVAQGVGWLRASLCAFAVFFASTSVVGDLASDYSADQVAVREKPLGASSSVLHLVLDELASPLGTDGPETGHPASALFRDLVERGFYVHQWAESTSSQTYESVSAVLGMTSDKDNYKKLPKDDRFNYRVTDNALFARALERGYAVEATQIDYLDICGNSDDVSCRTYTRGANMDVFSRASPGLSERLKFALFSLHEDYQMKRGRHGVAFYRAVVKAFGPVQSYGYFSRPLVVLELMEDIADDVRNGEQGVLSFHHLLLPHFPYVLRSDCSVKPISEWTLPLRFERTGVGREQIYNAYWDQAACTYASFTRILDAIPEGEDVWVVVHGDHGSRISSGTTMSSREDRLRTLLAIRGPGVSPGSSAERTDLQGELAKFYRRLLGM